MKDTIKIGLGRQAGRLAGRLWLYNVGFVSDSNSRMHLSVSWCLKVSNVLIES